MGMIGITESLEKDLCACCVEDKQKGKSRRWS